MTSSERSERFRVMQALPSNASTAEKARRGRDFESWLADVMRSEDLQPRTSYRPDGEEIDGSFMLSGRPYLLEAKWTGRPIPASSLYMFRGKVDGKLSGTIGLFISMAGYSTDAVDALIAGKTINLILMTKEDIEFIAAGSITFARAMEIKLRAAAEFGTPLVSLEDALADSSVSSGPGADDGKSTGGVDVSEPWDETVIVVEGRSDHVGLSRIIEANGVDLGRARFIEAFGRLNLSKVAKVYAERQARNYRVRFIVVADGDGEADRTRSRIAEDLDDLIGSYDVVVLDPDFETVLGIDRRAGRNKVEAAGSVSTDPAELWARAETYDSLRQLLEVLGIAQPGD